MDGTASLVWLRRDLRLADQPALQAAIARGGPVVPVFTWSPDEEGKWKTGAATRWWLHQSLECLKQSLVAIGSRLILRSGDAATELKSLARSTGAGAVYWNHCYEPASIERDKRIKWELREAGLTVESFNAALLHEPWEAQTKQKRPYQVFTPFWQACQALAAPAKPQAKPKSLAAPSRWPKSETLASLKLEPRIDWAAGILATWKAGENGAWEQLSRFLEVGLSRYSEGRDRPDIEGVSSMSPYLHFGEIGPRQIWYAVHEYCRKHRKTEASQSAEAYLRQIYWREFAHHLLYHFPHTTDEPLRSEFARFDWQEDAAALQAWQRGQTGYPLVDAGMRQLWTTGWMHNRVRMIVASLLVKDLMIPWQAGARWFWDTLVDADLANNTLGWQWTAGCGADAAPYFRIFNPVSQARRFDPEGDYVRRWVPELNRLPAEWIHEPWEAPADVLRDAGVVLGDNYPRPMVDHGEARKRALTAYRELRGAKR